MRISDWSSDVCSSDLHRRNRSAAVTRPTRGRARIARTFPDPLRQALRPAGARDHPRGDDRAAPSRLAGQRSRAAPRGRARGDPVGRPAAPRSEEHTSELQSLMRISYAVFCLKKKNEIKQVTNITQSK